MDIIMETKLVRAPFDVELAKKITDGDCKGRIVTRDGRKARVICWDVHNVMNILSLITYEDELEMTCFHFPTGDCELDCKDQNDLFLEVPEYMTFKDGDVISHDSCNEISIINAEIENEFGNFTSDYYVALNNGKLTYKEKGVRKIVNYTRHATEEEKQKFIDALKASKEPKAKEYLKRFFGIEEKKVYEFKPFDKVLARNKGAKWFSEFFSFIDEHNAFVCIGGYYEECIPYEGNEHLLGTTEDCEL